MFGLRTIGGFALSVVMVVLLLRTEAALAQCSSSPAAPNIKVELSSPARVRAGEPLEIRWKSEGRDKGCHYPLYLVFTTGAHVRFEGEWLLAFPAGGAGPFGISQKIDQTRVFIPLHAFTDKASGAFKVKFYTAGENSIDWFLAGMPGFFSGGRGQAATVLAAGSAPLTALVETGKPEIFVRDAFAPNIGERLAQLNIPANGARTEAAVQAFDWQETFDNPRRIIDLVTSKTPAVQPVFVIRKEAFDVPDYVDETHETKKIDPQRVRHFATWAIGSEQYRLIHEDYQSGNASTPNTQYLHLLSWNPAGQVRVVDLSSRLLAEGRIQNRDESLVHPLPSDLDIVTIVAGRYLLASGH